MANNREKYLLSEIEKYEEVVETDFEIYAPKLAGYYEELAELYEKNSELEKAEEYYIKSIEKYSALAVKNDEFLDDSIRLTHCLSYLCIQKGDIEEGEEHCLGILDFFKKLNSDYHKDRLADCYAKAGHFYQKIENFEEAKKYYLSAIDLYEQLEEEFPEDFIFELVVVRYNTGFMLQKSNSKYAISYYIKAFELCKKYYKSNSQHFMKVMVCCCLNMTAMVEENQNKIIKNFCLPTIEICEKLYEAEPVNFLEHISSLYLLASALYFPMDLLEAEIYARRAIDINEKHISDGVAKNIEGLANSYNNAAVIYNQFGNSDKAKEYYVKAIEIFLQIAKNNAEKYIPCLAVDFFELGSISEDSEEKEKIYKTALELAEKYPDHPWCREIIEFFE